MELKIGALKLQSLLVKALKGSSMNKMIPLTNFVSISVKDGEMVITTTDATNYLYIKSAIDFDGDFNVVVEADILHKLISKITCDYVELLVDDGVLTVVGNGTYKIELPLDEEGNTIKYPNPAESFNVVRSFKVKRDDIQKILMTAKASLSEETDALCYTGYYIGDRIVTTDTEVMCGINRDIGFSNESVLIYASTMDLLDLMSDTAIECSVDSDNGIMFKTANCVVCGKVMDCVNDFQIDVISDLLGLDFESTCKFKKHELMDALERVSLFVGVYDKNCVYLTFTEEGMLIQSMQTNSTETLKYESVDNYKSFTCCIDVEMLKTQIKAYTSEIIELQYGRDNAIKLLDDDTVQIVCLQDDLR